jgi:plastocyanin
MRDLKLLHVAALLMIAGVACGGGTTAATSPAPTSAAPVTSSPTPTAAPTCSPSGTALEITALNLAGDHFSYDKDCLATQADTAFTITFKNDDAGTTHNVAILDHPAGTSLFQGKIVTGPTTITYHVKAFPAGTYYFRCSIHHSMSGTFIVTA